MLQPLGKFLPKSVNRAGIGRQLEASNMVGKTDEFLSRLLDEKADLAKALSYKHGEITIECKSSTIANLINAEQSRLINFLKQAFPQAKLKSVRTRLTLNFDVW